MNSPSGLKILERSVLGMILVYLILYVFLSPVLSPHDYDLIGTYYEIAWRFWLTNGGLPQFNPLLCGGRSLGADPQIPIFSPLTLLIPLFGPVALVKLEMVTSLFLGTAGLVLLLERFQIGRKGQAWGALCFLAGGGVVSRFFAGHVAMIYLFLFPLFIYLSVKLCDPQLNRRHRTRWWYWLLFIYAGLYKPHLFIYGLPLLLIEAVCRSIQTKRTKPVIEIAGATLASGLVCMVAMLPAWRFFQDFPRPTTITHVWTPLYTFVFNLLAPMKSLPKSLYGDSSLLRHEYSFFLGPIAVWLAWVGFRSKALKQSPLTLSLVVLFFASMLLGLGSHSDEFIPWNLYSWFHRFWPGFDSVRVPMRMWFGAFFVLVVLSSVGIEKTKLPQWVVIGLGALPLVISGVIALSRPVANATQLQWNPPRKFAVDVKLVKTHPDDQYRHIRIGNGTIDCSMNLEINQSHSLKPEPMLSAKVQSDHPLAWGVERINWSRISVIASSLAPFKIQLNQNSSPYWTFKGQGRVGTDYGLPLTVESVNDEIKGELAFEQPWVLRSLIISILGWLGFIGYGIFALRKEKKIPHSHE